MGIYLPALAFRQNEIFGYVGVHLPPLFLQALGLLIKQHTRTPHARGSFSVPMHIKGVLRALQVCAAHCAPERGSIWAGPPPAPLQTAKHTTCSWKRARGNYQQFLAESLIKIKFTIKSILPVKQVNMEVVCISYSLLFFSLIIIYLTAFEDSVLCVLHKQITPFRKETVVSI